MSSPATVAHDRVAVLHQSVNEVLLHAGKALKAAQAQDSRDLEPIRSRLTSRMTETMDKYQNAVNQIEREVLDAKAVILRDLRAVRARIEASKRQQEAAAKPEQPKASLPSQDVPQAQTPTLVPAQGAPGIKTALQQQQQQQHQRQSHSQTPPIQRNGSQQSPAAQPVAPIPDMGVGAPTKAASPLLSKKTPSAGTPTPASKPSPQPNGAARPAAKASPASRASVPTPVPTPKPVPAAATSPPVASTPVTSTPALSTPVTSAAVIPTPVTATPAPAPPAPMSAAPVPMMDASQDSEFLNLPSATSGAGTLNFTDMAFTVDQGADSISQGQSQPISMDIPGSSAEPIDLESLFDTAGAAGGEQSTAPTASMDLDTTQSQANQPQQPSGALDDMYDLGEGTAESMDLDFEFDQSGGGGGDSYINDLLFGTGDSLGELDESGLV